MAKFTMELRDLIEKSNVDIGLKDYHLYTFKNIYQDNSEFGKDLKGNQISNFRDYLNNYILRHFYFREIGFETPARFVFKLNTLMSEKMVYYNQMLHSIDIDFNPLWNVDLTETFTHNVTDTGNVTSKTTGKETIDSETNETGNSKRNEDLEQSSNNDINTNSTRTPNLSSDTINADMKTAEENMTAEQIRQHSFVSEATHNLNTQTGNETTVNGTEENLKTTNDNEITTSNENNVNVNQTNNTENDTTVDNSNSRTETYTRKQEGSSAGYLFTQNIEQWRKIMINIPDMICEELEPCFMQIF